MILRTLIRQNQSADFETALETGLTIVCALGTTLRLPWGARRDDEFMKAQMDVIFDVILYNIIIWFQLKSQ